MLIFTGLRSIKLSLNQIGALLNYKELTGLAKSIKGSREWAKPRVARLNHFGHLFKGSLNW